MKTYLVYNKKENNIDYIITKKKVKNGIEYKMRYSDSECWTLLCRSALIFTVTLFDDLTVKFVNEYKGKDFLSNLEIDEFVELHIIMNFIYKKEKNLGKYKIKKKKK